MFPARLGQERQRVAKSGHEAQAGDYSGSGDNYNNTQTLINKNSCVSKVNKSKGRVRLNYSSVLAFQGSNMARMSVLRGESKIAGTRFMSDTLI